ncbi:MAG: MazG family protein [Caldilineaceae bacterium]|nr:MazG family protein [Caldilineaceae bacterium]
MNSITQSPLPNLDQSVSAPLRIVGLGPGALADLTLAAWQALSTAPRILARTRRHPALEELGERIPIQICDDLYEQHSDFAAVYEAITERVLTLAREPGGVVYAVPGHPWVGEATTRLILEQAAAAGITVQVIGGLSFVEPVYAAVGVDMMDGGQVVDAMLLAQQHHPQVEAGLPLVVGQLYSAQVASDVKLTLMNAYPDEHPVTLVQAAGTAHQVIQTRPLLELDHGDDFDHLTSLYVPPLRYGSFTDLQEIVALLRAPDGCPWDQEQTLESLCKDLLGEVAEVLEAIDMEAGGQDNSPHIAEELGDLYSVATMMVQIATEEGRFKMADSIHEIVTKLIRRHPHIFGDTVVSSVDQLVQNWDAIKAAEKAAKGQTQVSPLDGVPAHLPALEKARKLQTKAAKAGLLDRDVLVQARPALNQLLGDAPAAEVLGELLWQLVALAHQHDLNAEDALRAYAVAFRQRYG